MATTDLLLRVAAQTEDAQKQIKNFVSGVEKSLLGVGIALGAAFSVKGLVSFGKKSLAEFAKIEQATKSVTAALDSYGKASESAVSSATEFAESLDQTTRFAKENILSTQALIASLTGLSGDGLNRATQAAADLATVLGGDIQAAGRTLAKVASGNATALNRLGITFEKSDDAATNFNNALTAVENKLGGRAQKDALTLVGSLELLEKQFDSIFESTGTALAQQDFFVPLIQQTSKAIDQIATLLIKSVGPILRASIAIGGAIIAPIVAGIDSITGSLGSAVAGLGKFQNVIVSSLKGFFILASGVSVFVDAFIFLDSVLARVINYFLALNRSIAFLLEGNLSAAAKELSRAGEAFTGTFKNAFSTTNKVAAEGNKAISDVTAAFQDQNAAVKKTTSSYEKFIEEVRKAKADLEIKNTNSELAKTNSQVDELTKALSGVGLTNLQKIKDELNQRILVIEQSSKREQEKIQLIAKARLDAEQKIDAELLKQRQEDARKIGEIAASPLQFVFNAEARATTGAGAAAGVGALGSILQGEAGAKGLVTGLLGGIADTILPGIGGVVSQIVGVLAEGPDKVRETIRAFTSALPTVITNIIEAIPVLVEELGNAIPVIVDKLSLVLPDVIEKAAEKLPGIIASIAENPRTVTAFIGLSTRLAARAPFIAAQLAASLAAQAPSIAVSFVTSFVKEIPTIVKAILSEIKRGITGIGGIGGGSGAAGKPQDITSLALGGNQDAFGKLNVVQQTVVTAQRAAQAAASAASSIGNAVGGFFKSIFKRADGGLIPGGSPFVDRVPTLLTPGELVIDRSQNNRLDEFLNRERTGERDRDLLNQILSRLDGGGGEKNLTVNLMIGEDQLASALLNLNRRGFRMGT